jgi:hypothetical protein
MGASPASDAMYICTSKATTHIRRKLECCLKKTSYSGTTVKETSYSETTELDRGNYCVCVSTRHPLLSVVANRGACQSTRPSCSQDRTLRSNSTKNEDQESQFQFNLPLLVCRLTRNAIVGQQYDDFFYLPSDQRGNGLPIIATVCSHRILQLLVIVCCPFALTYRHRVDVEHRGIMPSLATLFVRSFVRPETSTAMASQFLVPRVSIAFFSMLSPGRGWRSRFYAIVCDTVLPFDQEPGRQLLPN